MSKFWKIGHRGACGYEPENTMRSFKKALELGADSIEFDVRRAQGGELVVIHDSTVDRTTNGSGLVCDLALSDLLSLDAGKGEKIPLLDFVLRAFGHKTVLNIELKEEGMAYEVLELIKIHNILDSVVVSAFDDSDNEPGDSSNWVDLLWMKRKEPNLKIALLVEKPDNFTRALEVASAYQIYAINPSVPLVTHPVGSTLMQVAHKGTHSLIFVWTVDDFTEIQGLKLLGVDGIFSNYPDRL